MYLSFYGLQEAPFSPTPDPRFLFQSARHREALAQLIYVVRERKGFLVLTGEIGTGKTTLLRTLLEKLGDTPLERRTARYVCHVAVADPVGAIRAESRDTCRGRIRLEPAGTNGFGYDPLFEMIEYHRTFGELGPTVKRMLSHRSRALRAILPKLIALQ